MDLYGPSDFAPGYVPPPPPIGSLITGVLVVSQKEKSRYRHMFAQWSPEGAPVKELARVTSFGSRMGDEDLRRCMRLTRKEGRDDLWFLCKLVLYNDLDMMKHAFRVQANETDKVPERFRDIKIHTDVKAFVTDIARQLDDEDILGEM